MRLFGAKHSKAKWCTFAMLAKIQTWGGPRSIIAQMHVWAINLLFRSRRAVLIKGNEAVSHVDSIGKNRLAVRLQKLYFMKPLFLKIQKLNKVKSRL